MTTEVRPLADLSELTIETDRYDRRTYRELFNSSGTLQSMVSQGGQALPTFAGLVQDVFSGLFKTAPQLLPADALRPDVQVNRGLLERAMQTQEWQTLRADTVMDEGSAAIGTLQMAHTLMSECQNNPKLKEMLDKAKEAAEQTQQAALNEMGGNQAEAEEHRRQAEALAREVQQAMEQNASAVRVAVRRAADAGQKSTEEAAQVFAQWGIGHGERQSLPVEKQLELLAKLTGPRLKHLAQLIGRYREMAGGHEATKTNRPSGDIHGVRQGRSLERALPGEIARLAHPLGRYDALRRLHEGQMFEYSLKQRPKLAKGDMVVMEDTSQSTESPTSGGFKIRDWCKAVCLGLYEKAWIERRNAAFIPFDDKAPETIFLKAGENDPEKLIEVATTWYGGGTNFQAPLTRGLAVLMQSPHLRGADLVLVTDGEWNRWDEPWLRSFKSEQKRLGFRLIGVAIRPTTTKGLERVCDVILRIEPTDEGYSEVLTTLG